MFLMSVVPDCENFTENKAEDAGQDSGEGGPSQTGDVVSSGTTKRKAGNFFNQVRKWCGKHEGLLLTLW